MRKEYKAMNKAETKQKGLFLTYFDESIYLEQENLSSLVSQQQPTNPGHETAELRNRLLFFEDQVLEVLFGTLARQNHNKANTNVMNLRAYFQ